MKRDQRINVPATKKEKDEIQKKAINEGYMNLSAYMRDKALCREKEKQHITE